MHSLLIFMHLIVMTGAVQTVLIISSFVASSHIGATASAFCLRRLGHEAVIIPTTLMGRHPGWGAPGGGAVKTQQLEDIWTAIKSQDIIFDAVLTGYMGETAHIALAAKIIRHVKSVNPQAYILVDPVMGDFQTTEQATGAGALYIPEPRAKAVCEHLIPLANIITPNLWELGYIGQKDLQNAQDALAVLKDLGHSAIVTSVPYQTLGKPKEIGALFYDGKDSAIQSHHQKFTTVPHGGGDSLAGLYLGHYLRADTPRLAMRKSVSTLFEIMSLAHNLYKGGGGELPLIQAQNNMMNPTPLDFIELAL
ncbi:MAG: bifunctional hydroxymethylpyrimidine kinase/phosphomethylpyrimidine kinase [Litorimonas sp.]